MLPRGRFSFSSRFSRSYSALEMVTVSVVLVVISSFFMAQLYHKAVGNASFHNLSACHNDETVFWEKLDFVPL